MLRDYVDLIDLIEIQVVLQMMSCLFPLFLFYLMLMLLVLGTMADLRLCHHFVSCSAPLTFTKADAIKAKHSLLQHQLKVIIRNDEEDVQQICVRQNSHVAGTFRQFSKAKTNVSKGLKVVFIGEASVNEGVPRREFF